MRLFVCRESEYAVVPYLFVSGERQGGFMQTKAQTKEKNYERGARIADRRKALGLSQDELAHRIGIGRQSLSAIETEALSGHRRLTAWRWSLRYLQTSSCMEQEVRRLSSLQKQ